MFALCAALSAITALLILPDPALFTFVCGATLDSVINPPIESPDAYIAAAETTGVDDTTMQPPSFLESFAGINNDILFYPKKIRVMRIDLTIVIDA